MVQKADFNPGMRRPLLWAVLLALGLRLVVVAFLYPELLTLRRDHWAFGYETGRIARSIVLGQGFSSPLYHATGPTAWMTPVYPYLLAGIFKVFGIYTKASAWAALTLNSLFSALTCVPIFYSVRRSFGEKEAIWTAWVWAVFPYAVYLSADFVWDTCLTTLLVAILFWMTLRLERSASVWTWMLYGLLWGVAALTNPAVLAMLPILAGWACIRLQRQGERWFFRAAAAGFIFLATLAPWEVRNYRAFHQIVPLRDNFGLEMWVGNKGDTSHWAIDASHPSENPLELAQYEQMGELAYMAKKQSQAFSFIASHPGTFAVLVLRRIVYTWTGYWSLARDYLAVESMDPWNMVLSVPITILMLMGLRRAFRESKDTAVLYSAIVIVFPLVYYITHPHLRYRHVIDPEIVVLACYAVVQWPRAFRKPKREYLEDSGSRPRAIANAA
jgi:hypothetical protein